MKDPRVASCPAGEDDRGSASVVGAMLMMSAVAAVAVVAGIAHVAVMNCRAATAADLAALSAADAARGLTTGDPCDVATSVARGNGARLVSCTEVPGLAGAIDVDVEVDLNSWVKVLGPARGMARAGPPAESSSEPR
ncbi:Rv3654c family TadE-like protein [Rothia sp. HC945]|uniref:Rv3654c family TadE-like protein n=1 Tax=Rothia sp. HC945 TaxID=3171170 RepID=UPI00264D3D89|nr:flp pilus-assembly TadE/G-like family protein [Kocuria sp.]MDN5617817.1 flp pilus-assembly TadE/G-like family protein [Kocuria sp.]MDN5653551.1 flp pilus-assembly TadE/G-like family protein [Kocuria sp.]